MIKVVSETKNSTVCISNLNIGDTFIHNEDLFIISDDAILGTLNLSHGGMYDEFVDGETQVIPVDIEIKVIRKEVK